MTRMLRATAVLTLAGSLGALAGCSFAPDSAAVRSSAQEVFDDLVAELSGADPGVIRAVEVLPEETQPCEAEAGVQEALLARGTLSVRAEDGAAAETLNTLGAVLGDDWSPVRSSSENEQRAWTSGEGIVVTLTNADPVLLVSVFPPCTAG